MDPFTIFFQGFTCIAQGILQTAFSGWFTGKRPKARHYAICILLLWLGSGIGGFFQAFLLSALLNLLAVYGLNRFLLGNGRSRAALTAVLAVSIAQSSYGIFNALTSVFLPYIKPGGWVLAGPLASAFSIALCLGCYLLAARCFPVTEELYGPYSFTLAAPILFLFATGFYIVNTVYGNVTVLPSPAEPRKHMEMLMIQAFGLCSLFSVLYAYRKLCESFQAKARIALLEQEARAQRTYVEEAKSRYEQTRAFRHDIRNHLSVLGGLLDTGQDAQAALYLKKLEGAASELSFPFQTGSPVIDILLSSKLELAARQEITIDCSLALPQPCEVDDLDLCVIFSNALDNALCACSQADAASRLIRIAGKRQGDFFLIEFENSCRTASSFPAQADDGTAGIRADSGEDAALPRIRPGVGMANIQAVAETYGGAMTYEYREGHFFLDVLLNIS